MLSCPCRTRRLLLSLVVQSRARVGRQEHVAKAEIVTTGKVVPVP